MSYSINDLIYINKDTGDTYFTGNILPIGSNQYSLGTSNLSWKDLNLSGNLNLQGGSLNMQNSTFSGDLLPSSSNTYNIGSSNLQWKNIYSQSVITSNLVVLNAYSTDYQIAPIRQVYYITSTPRSTFTLTTNGYFGGNACNVHIFVDNKKLTYYSDSLNNYQLAVSYDYEINKTNYTITLTSPAVFGNLVDITVWPKILKETLPNPMRMYQYVNIEYTAPISRPFQLPPIRQVFYVDSNEAPKSVFYITTAGVYGGTANNIQVFVGQSLLSYYSSSATDYTLNVTYVDADTLYTVTLTNPVQYASVVDITIWPTVISGSTLVGSIYQTINTGNSQWQTASGSDIYYYTSGNVGIGTNNPNIGKLVVGGSIVPSANSVYDLGRSDLRWKDLYISGNTIDLGGTKISRDDQSGGLMIKSGAGLLVDNTINTLYASNVIINGGNIGIGTTNPMQKLDIQGGNAIVSGSIGVGTTIPRQILDIQGGNAIISGSIGIGTTTPQATLHVNGDISSPVLTGQVAYFAMSSAPTGWLKCNGASLSRTTYAQLFNAIGTTFGAVDGNSFTLPDLRGEFLRGWDDGRSVDTSRTFGSAQAAAMLNHTHTGTTGDGGAHSHDVSAYNNANTGPSSSFFIENGDQTTTIVTSTHNGHSHSFTTGNPSTGGGSETRPRNVALLACIKY